MCLVTAPKIWCRTDFSFKLTTEVGVTTPPLIFPVTSSVVTPTSRDQSGKKSKNTSFFIFRLRFEMSEKSTVDIGTYWIFLSQRVVTNDIRRFPVTSGMVTPTSRDQRMKKSISAVLAWNKLGNSTKVWCRTEFSVKLTTEVGVNTPH